MVVIDTEHPPASGTALSVAALGISVKVVVFILATTIIISLVRLLLKRQLKNLVLCFETRAEIQKSLRNAFTKGS
jgi:hypothetical protein